MSNRPVDIFAAWQRFAASGTFEQPDSFREVDTDFDPDEYETKSAASSSGLSSRVRQPGTAVPSVYSFHSSRDGEAFLREMAGRKYNAQNELYFLPADEDEFSRLDKQHLMLILVVGGLYAEREKVQNILAPTPDGEQKMILDLGTGGGNWAIGMAQEFPHAQIVGVDLAPSTSRPPPSNCRFEFDDFTLGLSHYYNSFDIVHARSTANGVKDFEWFVNEAAKCVKPGGMLLMTEGNFELQNDRKETQKLASGDGADDESFLARMLFETYNTMSMRGSSLEAGCVMGPYMKRSPALTDAGEMVKFIPIGPWEGGTTAEETRTKELIGILMRRNSIEFTHALRPVLISAGYPSHEVEKWVDGAEKELNSLSLHMYVKWHFAWATKAAVDGQEPIVAGDFTLPLNRPFEILSRTWRPRQPAPGWDDEKTDSGSSNGETVALGSLQ